MYFTDRSCNSGYVFSKIHRSGMQNTEAYILVCRAITKCRLLVKREGSYIYDVRTVGGEGVEKISLKLRMVGDGGWRGGGGSLGEMWTSARIFENVQNSPKSTDNECLICLVTC